MGNTGLLTQRCDPFGAESRILLAGGLHPENHVGKVMWHCPERAIARYRMICTGGTYGFRRSPGAGIVPAYHCPGGHKGQVMPLCLKHVRDFTTGPPRPGFTRDLRTPVGQVGGTRATDLCPACAFPPEARVLSERADYLNQQMAKAQAYGLMTVFARLQADQDTVRARLDELNESGRIHKCPLILREVS